MKPVDPYQPPLYQEETGDAPPHPSGYWTWKRISLLAASPAIAQSILSTFSKLMSIGAFNLTILKIFMIASGLVSVVSATIVTRQEKGSLTSKIQLFIIYLLFFSILVFSTWIAALFLF